MRLFSAALIALSLIALPARAADGNRLTYLDSADPYYVSRTFPKLTTPMWVGEEGVDAVIVLAIDDMRGHEKWEAFLRPALERLKQIDGRAPVSIMTCKIDPADPHLQQWLKEGLSLETHTFDHPCPIMADGNFDRAKATYDKCVDQMFGIPNNVPVAFRTPCCDSLNTPSPRLFAEIVNKTTEQGHFLTIDSSVFTVPTPNDPELPREVVFDEDGRDRFRKYLPFKSFANTVDDYPYPYVIGKLCWEFPCIVPSDWEGFNINKAFSPITLRDMKAALDAVVAKQGTYNLVFHPHGWLKPEQLVDLIDYAATKYGKRIKFLAFKEAQDRLNKNLLAGYPLRAEDGKDNGVRLLDVNNDGYLDVIVANTRRRLIRTWSPADRKWIEQDGVFPVELVDAHHNDKGGHFGVDANGDTFVIMYGENGWARGEDGAWRASFGWQTDLGPFLTTTDVKTTVDGRDQGVRLRDIDGDGDCELIVCNPKQNAIYKIGRDGLHLWEKLPFGLPPGATIVDAEGRDAGLRFVDVDEDGHPDVLFSNDEQYGLYLFTSMKDGWSKKVTTGKHGEKPISEEIPKIVRDGTNNGAWVHSRTIWWRNESTSALPDKVDRRTFNALLGAVPATPKSADASRHSIKVAAGFQVELMVAEPLVQDPVAMAWGADGKLWVVEMADYPNGMDGKGAPGGRVKYLESTKGDGHYDKVTLFLDKVPFPTGVTPWRKGVIVTAAPEIFYAEDTDGDGKADVRKALYTGFVEGNQQHRINTLALGLDNWLYCANGHSNGKVTSTKTGATVDISGRDVRIKPDEGLIETVTGVTQFGRARDDYGDWFGNDNSNPMFHFLVEERYVRRNPNVAPGLTRQQVSTRPGAAPIFPISRTLTRFNDPGAANHFTSANSAIVYRDDLFGPQFSNSTFVSEPVHNLVHREVLSRKGVTFTSQRAPDEQESEFFASSDGWSRPTNLQTGPDGALWIADMYRETIEHPQWIPKDWQAKLDLRAGSDKGRIYRVYPVGKSPRAIPRLDKLDTAALVAALDTPNGWQRDTVQRLLVERHDMAGVSPLRQLATQSANSLARLHAICILDGLAAIDEEVLLKAINDPHPGVRRNAVRIAEPSIAKSSTIATAVAKLVDDAEAPVRLQVACSLGFADPALAGPALAKLAARDTDPVVAAAILSSITKENLDAFASALMPTWQDTAPPAQMLEGLVRTAKAYGGATLTLRLMAAVASPVDGDPTWRFTATAAMLDALDQAGTPYAKLTAEPTDATIVSINQLFDRARAIAADASIAPPARLPALRLLGRARDRQAEDVKLLASLISPQSPPELQSAAAEVLGRRRDPQAAKILLAGWKTYGPALRSQIVDALCARSDGAAAVLDAVEHGQIKPAEVDAARRQKLLQDKNGTVRQRAQSLLAGAVNADRAKVVAAYHDATTLSGDAARGREVFTKTCATCHRLGGAGSAVGPDLSSIGNKTPDGLLTSILDPNAAVEARFVNYLVETREGDSFSGILSGETGNSVTLAIPGGEQKTFLRSDLKSLRSTGLSLMPEGLEAGLTKQDVADLIAAIRGSEAPRIRKTFEGNKPELVRADGDGKLHLLSSNAEIYGSTLILEPRYGNLGYWKSEDDQAVWTVDVPAAGKWTVQMHYACQKDSAGSPFVLQAGAIELPGTAEPTISWDNYRRFKVGDMNLPAGKQQFVLRPIGKPNGALMDLEGIVLTPVVTEPK